MRSRLFAAILTACVLGLGGALWMAARAQRLAARGASTTVIPKGLVRIQLLLGNRLENKAKVPTKWDGTVAVSQGGRLAGVEIPGQSAFCRVTEDGWQLTTMRTIPRMKRQRERGYRNMPLQNSMVWLNLAGTDPNTKVDVETTQGDFSFLLKDVPFGTRKRALRGLVQIARLPNTAKVLTAPTEDDFPAAVYDKDGNLCVVYTAFSHGEGFARRPPIPKEPKDFSYLEKPTGGDRIFLMRHEGDAWSRRMPVTPPGQDVFRPAIAADGTGRIWVVWSANVDENWDLYVRSLEGSKWSKPIRLTRDPGPDLFPATATDAAGRVWIAWQAFRGNNSSILALRQEASGFGRPLSVSDNPANEWDPAIAVAPGGEVAFAWDTYAKGDYDVYARIWSNGKLGDAIPIATSPRGEMRASATFDAQGRLWVAYEDSSVKWGKDWGKDEKTGARLYEARSVGVRVWDGTRLLQPADQPSRAFLPQGKRPKRVGNPWKLAAPRLATDRAGRVWLAARRGHATRAGVGSVWFEHLAWYEGECWSDGVFCPETDGLLDGRPALVARPEGGVTVVTSTDMRFAQAGFVPPALRKEIQKEEPDVVWSPRPQPSWPDPINFEIAMAEIPDASLAAPVAPELVPAADPAAAPPSDEAKSEAEDIARMRAYRATVAGKPARVLRGEFHRHTEISGDGGNDGMLMDMWRYALDTADMDWIGNGDHDNGGGREYSWWLVQKTTSMFRLPGIFEPMYTYERSVRYPDGHRNVVFVRRGIRPLPRLRGGTGTIMDDLPAGQSPPHSPDTLMLYRYLKFFDGLCASHTSATDMGTDWRDNDPKVEPVVEIYQGDRQNYEMPGAPRANTAGDSAGGWRPRGFVSLALQMGYRLGFQASSDHVSTHMSYCNVWVEEITREAIFEAMKRRHIYGATDNIIAEFHCGEHFMGDEFTIRQKPTFRVRIIGTKPLARVHIIKDGKYAFTTSPDRQDVTLEWTDVDARAGSTSYYYVRGEQTDGELVWISPMWITYKP